MRFAIFIAIVLLAIVFGLATLKFSSPDSTPQALQTTQQQPVASEVATVDVLVARTDIPVGTSLTEAMVDRQPWPKHLVLEGFIISGSPNSSVEGMVARSDFKAREPLMTSKLAKPNDASFLAASLPAGMRAVTVAVDSVSAVAGYIFPGDRVDVTLSHNIPQKAPAVLWGQNSSAAGNQVPTTAEVLLANIRVLAVNNRKIVQPAKDGQQAPQAQKDADSTPANITLEVSQDDAKKLRLAEKNGTLGLALRPLADEQDTSVGQPVTLLDLSRVEGGMGDSKGWNFWKSSGSRQQNESVVIIRGVQVEQNALPFGGQEAAPAGGN